jgi:hypothetical protein
MLTNSTAVVQTSQEYKSYPISDTVDLESTSSSEDIQSDWLKSTDNSNVTKPRNIQKSRSIAIASQNDVPSKRPDCQSSVNGVILQANEITVKCELDLGGKHIDVQLPRNLFPEAITYGQPIILEMIEEHGIRRPRISLRQPNFEKFKDLRDKAVAILEEF